MAMFEEALAGMRKGEKWRRTTWVSSLFIRIIDGLITDENGYGVSTSTFSVNADDWQRYTEPAKPMSLAEAVRAAGPDGQIKRRDGTWCPSVKMAYKWSAADLVADDWEVVK